MILKVININYIAKKRISCFKLDFWGHFSALFDRLSEEAGAGREEGKCGKRPHAALSLMACGRPLSALSYTGARLLFSSTESL